MILKDLKIFSQNIQKNNFMINTILKVNPEFWELWRNSSNGCH